jgi:hypothetical protein
MKMPHHTIRGLVIHETGHPPAVSGFKTKIAATARLGLLDEREFSLHKLSAYAGFYMKEILIK